MKLNRFGRWLGEVESSPFLSGGMSILANDNVYSALGIAAETPREHAVVRQRFLALKKQFRWIYGIFLVNLFALNLASISYHYEGFNPTPIFLVMIGVRLLFWVRLGDRKLEDSLLQRALVKSYIVASLICGTFCAWVIALYGVHAGSDSATVLIFASLTAVGIFYGLTSFPAAARATIYFLNLPVAVLLITSGDPAQFAIGCAQFLLILLMLRMLAEQDGAFVRLVTTRFDMEAGRQNAMDSEQCALEEKARFIRIANTDPLTGLMNRRGLLATLDADTQSSRPWGLIILDVDGFKPINDTFGHAVGDELLIEVGARLSKSIGAGGCAARLGGDEFAILCHAVTSEDISDFASNAVKLLGEPYPISAHEMSMTVCAGVSWKKAGETPGELVREADIALCSSKKLGRGTVTTFSPRLQREVQRKTKIEQALRQPRLVDAIDLAYQPIYDLDSLEIRSFEALARWEHSELGWISPAEFIPLTEQLSTIEQLSASLLRRAATAALSWPTSVKLSFNLSPVQLSTAGSGERVLRIIGDVGLSPDRLNVEVTETALLADFDTARSNLGVLKRAGVSIFLDDFGAGYASISYLREMSFDAVKLDGSLVTAISDAGPALPLLRGVLALCQAMGRLCIAEHIENDAQLHILRQLGCRYGQGFGLARPMSEASARELARPRIIDIAEFNSGARRGRI